VKIVYLLSSVLPYKKLICDDAGPVIAKEYGWETSYIDSLGINDFDVVIVDNRHHDPIELNRLRSFILSSTSTQFFLRINDPCFFHRLDPWYQFCFSLLDAPRVHFLSPYQPTGILSQWLSHSKTSRFVYAPYTYDLKREHDCNHSRRIR